jgi:hypothetical protein
MAKKSPPKKPSTRARTDKGAFKGDDPATPDVNEAWDPPQPTGEAPVEEPAPEAPVEEAAPAAEPESAHCTNPGCVELRGHVQALLNASGGEGLNIDSNHALLHWLRHGLTLL